MTSPLNTSSRFFAKTALILVFLFTVAPAAYSYDNPFEEHYILQKFSSQIEKTKKGYKVRATNGKVVELNNYLCYCDGSLHYSFDRYYDDIGYFLFGVGAYESVGYLLVSKASGEELSIDTYPVVSDDKKFISSVPDLDSESWDGDPKPHYYKVSSENLEELPNAPKKFVASKHTINKQELAQAEVRKKAVAEMSANKVVVAKVMQTNPEALAYASKALQDDEEILRIGIAVKKHDNIKAIPLQYASERLRDKKDVVLAAIEANPFSFEYASQKLKDDEEVVNKATSKVADLIRFASDRLQNDKKFMAKLLGIDGRALSYASEKIRDDKDLALIAVTNSPESMQFVSKRLRDDSDFVMNVVLNCIRKGPLILKNYVTEKMLDDENFVRKVFGEIPTLSSLFKPSERLQNDKKFILSLKKHNLCYASTNLNNDEQFSQIVIAQDPFSLCCASENIKKKYSNITAKEAQKMVSKDAGALYCLAEKFRDDEIVVRQAVETDPVSLSYASERLRNSKDFVTVQMAKKMVSKRGTTLHNLPQNLRDNEEVALAAIEQDHIAVIFISDRLKKDKKFLTPERVINLSLLEYMLSDKFQYGDQIKVLLDNEDVIFSQFTKIPRLLCEASDRLRNDKKFIAKLASKDTYDLGSCIDQDLLYESQ